MDEITQKRIKELIREEISIVTYNPRWPQMFQQEKKQLQQLLPVELIRRIEHFGSTAVSHLSAKPIIDMLVEVRNLEETKKQIVPILKKQGYEYFWRPSIGNKPPYYAWFIKRNKKGRRTHHIHMVEQDSILWDRLYFRDYLNDFPAEAKRYDTLKKTLSKQYPKDRISYTKGKTKYIENITRKAKTYYTKKYPQG